MTSSVRILHLEDDPTDAELIALQLASDGWTPDIVRVKSHVEYTEALGRGGFRTRVFEGLSGGNLGELAQEPDWVVWLSAPTALH